MLFVQRADQIYVKFATFFLYPRYQDIHGHALALFRGSGNISFSCFLASLAIESATSRPTTRATHPRIHASFTEKVAKLLEICLIFRIFDAESQNFGRVHMELEKKRGTNFVEQCA